MGIRDDIRIGKLYPLEPDLPGPSSLVPDGCERVRTSARTWRVFRKATAFELKYGRELVYGIDDEPDPDMRRVMEEEGARPTSLIPVHQPRTRDPLHDLQLQRDLKLINERTVKEWGQLPKGGVPVQKHRKPMAYRVHTEAPHSDQTPVINTSREDNAMKSSQLATAVMMSAGVLSGCGRGDPWHPTVNPHPQKRYEVTAVADAPGPWDSVKGVVFFDVVNVGCIPQNSFTGTQNIPNTGQDFEMTRIDAKTWRGYIYRDQLLDEDYFGQGTCHWDATGITPVFTVHGQAFGAATWLEDALRDGPKADYFKKAIYTDRSSPPGSVPGLSSINPHVVNQPNAFFPITVTVKEATP